jgi:hypothetical protein
MKVIDRRSFLVVGAGYLSAPAAAPAQSSNGATYRPAVPSGYQFLVQPGMTARYNSATQQTFQVVPWALFPTPEVDIANFSLPQSYSVEELEAWAEQKSGNCCSMASNIKAGGAGPIDTLVTTPLIGTPATSDIEGAVVGGLADGTALDLSLDFIPYPGNGLTPHYSVSNISGVLIFEGPTSSTLLQMQPGGALQPEAPPPPPSVELFGWRLQFRGPETHPLGSCVSAPVTHISIDVFQAAGGGRYNYAANFHLGTYRSGGKRCFVLYNNVRPVVCWKTCSPTMGDLAAMFRWMLAAAAAVLAVTIAAWIIATIAEAAASVAFAPLLLLA